MTIRLPLALLLVLFTAPMVRGEPTFPDFNDPIVKPANAALVLYVVHREGGSTALSFDPMEPSQVRGPPDPSPSPEARYRRMRDYPHAAPPTILTFRSPPLPMELALNATRAARFHFALAECAAFDSALSIVDGPLVAATESPVLPSDTLTDRTVEGRSAGSCAGSDTYRDMPAQIETWWIPRGAVLQLQIFHHDFDWVTLCTGIGPGCTARSRIVLPVFFPEDADRRGLRDSDVVAPQSMLVVWAPGILLALVRAPRPALAVLMTGLVALGGCLRDTPTPSSVPTATYGGEVTGYSMPPDADGTATVVGFVHDRLGTPLPDVRVNLLPLGTTLRTGSDGTFRISQLGPGELQLVFVKEGYLTFHTAVRLPPGHVLHVRLNPVETNPDLRPHSHDYWNGATSVTILSDRVKLSAERCGSAFNRNPECARTLVTIPPAKPGEEPRLIPPGTEDVEVRIRWPSANEIHRMGLIVQTLSDADFAGARRLAARGANEPFHVRTTWEMGDVGHQPTTAWRFFIFVQVPNAFEEYRIPEPVEVEIVAHRGRLPLERPHPDFWKGKDTYRLVDYERLANSYGVDRVVLSTATGSSAGATLSTMPPAPRLVLPEATHFRATLEQSWDSSVDYEIQYQTAEGGAHWHSMSLLGERQPRSSAFVAPICAGAADHVYQASSRWAFRVAPARTDYASVAHDGVASLSLGYLGGMEYLLDENGLAKARLMFGLTVVVHRDAPPHEVRCP